MGLDFKTTWPWRGRLFCIAPKRALAALLAALLPWTLSGTELILALSAVVLLHSRLRDGLSDADRRHLEFLLPPLSLFCLGGLVANLHALLIGAPLRIDHLLAPVWLSLAFLIPALLLPDAPAARRAISVLLGVGAVVALYGVLQYFTGLDLARAHPLTHEFASHTGRYRVIGLFSHPLTFAYSIAFILFFGLARALDPTSPSDRWLGAATALLAELALWMTGARGAWLATAPPLLWLLVRHRSPLSRLVPAFGVAVIAAPALLLIASGTMQDRALKALDPADQRPRLLFWEAALHQLEREPLLGVGTGNFRQAVRREMLERAPDVAPPAHAHQLYLQLWTEQGIVALAGLLWLCVRWLRLGRRDRTEGAMERALVSGALGGIVAFLVGGLTQDTLGDAEVQRMLAFTGAVLLAAARPSRLPEPAPEPG